MDPLLRASPPLPGQELIPALDLSQGDYRVRFARTEADLDAACKLRFEVFNLELGEGLDASYRSSRDRDQFDAQCQHLLVLEHGTDRAVGTYRLQVAEAALRGRGFYSATEFDLSGLPPAVQEDAVELGRACVAKEHRSRNVLFLLWKGLAAYVLWNRKRYFFGCNSLTSQDPALGLRTYRHLQASGCAHPEYRVLPLPGRECRDGGSDEEVGDIAVPTLFGIYLRYGAKVCGPPAIDREFGTIDFLTILDVHAVDPKVFHSYAR